jgi:hypothetical protein
MAPNTVGHRETDHLRIVGLIEAAIDFAIEVLKPGGTFVAKAFQGGGTDQLIAGLKQHFRDGAERQAEGQPPGQLRGLPRGHRVQGALAALALRPQRVALLLPLRGDLGFGLAQVVGRRPQRFGRLHGHQHDAV